MAQESRAAVLPHHDNTVIDAGFTRFFDNVR